MALWTVRDLPFDLGSAHYTDTPLYCLSSMNFLGHCLYSDANPAALAGSLWPDFACRPSEESCSVSFLQHFDQHQQIDHLTDNSSILEPLRQALRPVFRKTAPLIVDMLLDHFLANHWVQFHIQPLPIFAQQSYQHLHNFNERVLPERMQRTLYWMSRQDWFVRYQSKEGIKDALVGMARRIRFANPIVENRDTALGIYADFQSDMTVFIEWLSKELGEQKRLR
ncbi:MAG: acyl carrier protein phosphodiesterase [Reinekea sp.]